MNKTSFGLIVLLIILTTYNPKFDFMTNSNLKIKKVEFRNNFIVKDQDLKKKLSFVYDENLFFLNKLNIQKKLKEETFIESFIIKKIYPNKIRITIVEKLPIAILLDKKKKFYISNKGDLINFINVDEYNDLPTVFGGGKYFYSLYISLLNINFSIENIKSFYFFESGRWDLILKDGKVIKLPINDYLISLKNFIISGENPNFDKYKIFDYRIKDQLILN